MRMLLVSFGIGFVSGLLSGAFGIGGGVITTPAIRLILDAPALIAVGTPLPVIIPSALTGSINYTRNKTADLRAGVICGLAGSVTAVIGALATRYVGGTVVLLATAALILYTSADMLLQAFRPPKPRVGLEAGEERDAFERAGVALDGDGAATGGAYGERSAGRAGASAPRKPSEDSERLAPPVAAPPPPSVARLGTIGALTGLYAGFLGLGGGFVLVPMLTRWVRFDIKRAIGTSLIAIAILAVPGTITHAFLGHIDWRIAAALTVGVIPGAWLGARFTLGSAERTIRIAFAGMLLLVGVWLAVSEIAGLGR